MDAKYDEFAKRIKEVTTLDGLNTIEQAIRAYFADHTMVNTAPRSSLNQLIYDRAAAIVAIKTRTSSVA